MIPWSLRWRSWLWKPRQCWREHRLLLFLAALGLAFLLQIIVMNRACGKEPEIYIMSPQNLAVFEIFLKDLGIQAKAESGVVLGTEAERQAGTGTAVVRVRDAAGAWLIYKVETVAAKVIKINWYPARPPANKPRV